MLNSRTAHPRRTSSILPPIQFFFFALWLAILAIPYPTHSIPSVLSWFLCLPFGNGCQPKKISEQSPPNAKHQAARILFILEVHSLHFHSIPLMVPLRCTNAPFHFSSVHFTTNHFYIKVLQLATLQPSLICSIFFAIPAVSPALKTKTHAKTSTALLSQPTHFARRNIVPLNPPTGNSCTSHKRLCIPFNKIKKH